MSSTSSGFKHTRSLLASNIFPKASFPMFTITIFVYEGFNQRRRWWFSSPLCQIARGVTPLRVISIFNPLNLSERELNPARKIYPGPSYTVLEALATTKNQPLKVWDLTVDQMDTVEVFHAWTPKLLLQGFGRRGPQRKLWSLWNCEKVLMHLQL